MQAQDTHSPRTKLGRRALGLAWLSVWVLVLWAFASPWPHMGGLVDERVRWAARFFPSAALIVGWLTGGEARDAARRCGHPTHAVLLRRALLPAAALVALGLGLAQAGGRQDIAGVVVLVLLGWAAGLDAGFAVWPLLFGRPYRFAAPIPAEPDPDETRDGDDEG